jgi:hypothetical protein
MPAVAQDKILHDVLVAADDDLCVLLDAVAHVVIGRNYGEEGARRETEQFVERLRDAVEARLRKPRLVRTHLR